MLTLISFLTKPLRNLFKFSFKNYKIKRKNRTLKVSGNSIVNNTVFGDYNCVDSGTLNNCQLGDYSYVGLNSYLNNVVVGKYTCIGPHVQIGRAEHPVESFVSVHPVFYSPVELVGTSFSDKYYFKEFHETTIGNDVWIGANVIIIGGVHIGDGAIIAAGAVVVKDVPSYTIVGGVPAKIIRTRFAEDKIRKLEELKWWNKSPAWLRENFKKFHSIDSFFD